MSDKILWQAYGWIKREDFIQSKVWDISVQVGAPMHDEREATSVADKEFKKHGLNCEVIDVIQIVI